MALFVAKVLDRAWVSERRELRRARRASPYQRAKVGHGSPTLPRRVRITSPYRVTTGRAKRVGHGSPTLPRRARRASPYRDPRRVPPTRCLRRTSRRASPYPVTTEVGQGGYLAPGFKIAGLFDMEVVLGAIDLR